MCDYYVISLTTSMIIQFLGLCFVALVQVEIDGTANEGSYFDFISRRNKFVTKQSDKRFMWFSHTYRYIISSFFLTVFISANSKFSHIWFLHISSIWWFYVSIVFISSFYNSLSKQVYTDTFKLYAYKETLVCYVNWMHCERNMTTEISIFKIPMCPI